MEDGWFKSAFIFERLRIRSGHRPFGVAYVVCRWRAYEVIDKTGLLFCEPIQNIIRVST